MSKENHVSKIIYAVIFVLAVALDQITKNLATTMLDAGEPVNVIKNVFQFVYTENQGAAFGMMQGKQTFFYIITFIVIAAILYFLIKMPDDSRYLAIGVVLSFILAGAVGNLIDRLTHKYVVDFIYFKPIDFPVFNVADCYITCSAIALILVILFKYRDEDDLKFLSFRTGKTRDDK